MTVENQKQRYTVQGVADLLQVSDELVYKLIRLGKLGCIRYGRCIRIRQEDLDAYEEAQCQQSASRGQESMASRQKLGISYGQTAAARVGIQLARHQG